MYINKGLKRERKNKRVFILFMTILSIILFLSIYLIDKELRVAIIPLLIIIEILIFIAIVLKIDNDILVFNIEDNKLIIKNGILYNEDIIFCDKVSMIHVDKNKDDTAIILITTEKQVKNGFKAVNRGLLKKHSDMKDEYLDMKNKNLKTKYYFKVIKKGGLKKYILLDKMYKDSFKATFTDSAIECVRVARMVSEI